MKPVKFKEQTTEVAKNQDEYITLPAFINPYIPGQNRGEVIFCTKGNLWERLRFLWTGEMWVSLSCFGNSVTPSFLSTKKSDVLMVPKK